MGNVFDAAAADFLALAPRLWDPVGEAVCRIAAPEPGEHVLDACCGAGSSAIPAAVAVGPHGRVDAVDLSAPLVTAMRDRAATACAEGVLRPAVHDVATWSSGPYELVLCVLGLPFLPDPAAGAARLAGMLVSGGRLVLAHWRAAEPGGRLDMKAFGEALFRIVSETAPGAEPAPPPARAPNPAALAFVSDLRGEEGMRTRLTELGLTPRTRTVQLALELDDEALQLLVDGSAFRGMVAGLGPVERSCVQGRLLERFAGLELDVSLVVGVGVRA
ncbi:MAG: methyltransferase domain-containing protein [Pseudoclavibacter sp.]|nr:methyltransferase domain-containing protein [Pseudoclavibacter sp.]